MYMGHCPVCSAEESRERNKKEGTMDEKLLKALVERAQVSFDITDDDYTVELERFIKRVFRAGCAAQSEADRLAVSGILSWRNPKFPEYGHEWDCHVYDAIAALTAAAIKESK
jgi:hypothetical protein